MHADSFSPKVITDKPNPNIKTAFEKKVETSDKMKKISPYEVNSAVDLIFW